MFLDMKKLMVTVKRTIDGKLIKQKNPSNKYAGRGKDCIGPGHYNINRELKHKGTNWHASAVEREFNIRYNKLVEKSNIGPGSYNIERTLSHSKPKKGRQTITASLKTIPNYRDEPIESDDSSEGEDNEEVLVEYGNRM